MAASAGDLFTNTASTSTTRPQATQVTSARSAGVFTLACNSLTGWPTDSAVEFCTYKLTTAGAKIAGSQIDMKGIVSGTTIGSITIRGGVDVGNAIGDIVEMAPTASWGYDLYQGLMASHNRDGTLTTAAVQAALGLSSLSGYTPVGFTPNTVTYNGNRSYDMVFNSQDLTSFLSNGMRIRTTRTVTAPTQCTSLNGTTQYYSKTSPAGMTFTTAWVAGAWVKLTSYPSTVGTIISRYNGTNGWELHVNSTGTVTIIGYNGGSGNYRQFVSYQSIPLNKWVHITPQMDMTVGAGSEGPTTTYIMIDGLPVPGLISGGGTAPSSIVQAGNLEVGSYNAGAVASLFPGKIAQAFVTSAKLTQTQVRSIYSQGLTSADMATYSIISAYSFNNSINDINTTNANNLTANGSAVATNADSPFGGQADGTISSTLDYAEIYSASFSTNTTVSVRVPDVNTIPTSGGVAAVVYSSNQTPYGWPGISSTLAYAEYRGSNFSTAATTVTQLLGETISATIPVGGKEVEVVAQAGLVYNSTAGQTSSFELWEGAVGSGTRLQRTAHYAPANNTGQSSTIVVRYTPTPGAKTWNIGVYGSGGTTGVESNVTQPVLLSVKVLNK